ncbi:hypothetical protein ACKKBG_A38850 [Auxenochlorella protothecoides x Auxenochlorella symbiontica]
MNIPQAQQVILNSAEAWELSAHLRSRDMNVTGDELVGRLRAVAHYGRQNLSPRRMEFLPPTQLASPPSPEGINRDTAPALTSSPTNPPPVLSPPSQQMELRAAPGSDAAGPSAVSPASKTSPSQRLAGGGPHPSQTPQTHPQAEHQNQVETQTLPPTQALAEPRSQDEPRPQANAGAVAEAQPQAEAGVEDEPQPQAEAQSLPEARAQTVPGALTRNRAHAAATAPVPATQPVQQVEDREDSAGEEVRMETHATQAPAAQSNMAAAAGVVQGGEEEEFSSDTSDDDTDEDSQDHITLEPTQLVRAQGGSPPRAPPSHAAPCSETADPPGPSHRAAPGGAAPEAGPSSPRAAAPRPPSEPLPRAVWDSSLRPPLFTQEAGASQPWGLGLETQAAAGPSQAAAEVPPGPSPVQAEAGVQVDPAELQAYLSGPGRRARGLAAAQRFHAPVAPGAPDVVTLERGGEHATMIRPGPGPRPALPPSILAARRKIAEVAGDLDPEDAAPPQAKRSKREKTSNTGAGEGAKRGFKGLLCRMAARFTWVPRD